MKLLVAILIVIIILCFVSFYCIYSNLIQPLKDENHRCRKEVQDINSYNLKLEQQRKKIEESYYCASEKALELARELSVTKDIVTKQAEEIGLLKTDLTANEGLEDKRQALLDSLTSVQNAIQERNILLHEMDLKIQEETARLDEAHRKEKDSLKTMQTMETRSKEIEAEVNKLIAQQEDLKTRIEDLKSWHRLALQEHNKEEDNLKGVRLELYGREVKMAALLNELKETYGELLASDLANIEWKRIWLPKIQEVCAMKMLETRSGIYMIKVHGGRRAMNAMDGGASEAKCYVGQAANIKERWYQHIKRMLGVDGTKGNERLYDEVDGHVERCEWIVLEEWNGDGSGNGSGSDRNEWLDEREKYWIEYFGCKEWGLNKK